MEKAISPLYQTALAIKLWLPAGAETQSWLPLLCVRRERETAVLRDSRQEEA